ncbi:MAG: hypothetical protein JKY37_26000 [Nannocystaceae bacterium]|nr:hypothetical protein [Nannocystaceae bacterium]
MNGLWRPLSDLLDVARGRGPTALGPAERFRLITAAGLFSLVFAAIWGVAAGSTSVMLAGSNALKVPMVVLFSVLSSLPAGVIALRLSGSKERVSDLVLSFCGAVFSGTLVAAVLAPIVAIYPQTSQWAGPYLGMGSVLAAIGVAALLFFNNALRNVPREQYSAHIIPKIVLAIVTLAVLPQLIALASPILQATTVWDAGVDIVTHG